MKPLKFEPWPPASFSILFWKSLAAKKVDDFQKGRINRTVFGFFRPNSQDKASLFFSSESLLDVPTSCVGELGDCIIHLPGTLVLCDTIEEFKSLDLQKEALQLLRGEEVESANYFVLFVFADVKKFRFYHQIAYPVQIFEKEQICAGEAEPVPQPSLPPKLDIISLDNGVLHFNDPSSARGIPGWPLRQYLTSHAKSLPKLLSIWCHRPVGSFKLAIEIPEDVAVSGLTGWERSSTDASKIAPVKVTDISKLMDPVQLARQAGELNLKLMKWRLSPNLDLEKHSACSCLLVGAGTLGCNVARGLMAWGFRKITFIDNGRVSYSNPLRQSLFTFEDAKDAKLKAVAAAERLQQIDPNVVAEGHEIFIPMPGHTMINEEESRESFEALKSLISSHDVIFLLTDSRESRWLPALIGHCLRKIVITVGLGFDSFVVMRHGMVGSDERLSCYFCHDVVGPVDSLTGRSLDQQCTVTRPGVSQLASGLAVELLASLLQCPDGPAAHANAKGLLGIIPHQIRGNFANFEQLLLQGTAFEHCTCCSDPILRKFSQNEFDFVRKACNSANELETISGLTALKESTAHIEILSLSDDEDSFEIINE